MVARFGVGYDNVDVEACNEAGIAARHHAGRRAPAGGGLDHHLHPGARRQHVRSRTGWRGRGPRAGPSAADAHGRGPRRQDAGPARHRQYRRRDASGSPSRSTCGSSPTTPTPTPRSWPSSASSWCRSRTCSAAADFLSVSVPLSDADAAHGERAPARADEADRLPDQHGARADRRPGRALPGAEGRPDRRRRPRRVRGRAARRRASRSLQLDNVILAPHALCWTDQCFAGIGASDVAAVQALMRGEVPRGVVNRAVLDNPAWRQRLDGYRQRFGGQAGA